MSDTTPEIRKRIKYLKMAIMRLSHLYYYPAPGRAQPPEDYVFDCLEAELAHWFELLPLDDCFPPGYELPACDRGAREFEEMLQADPLFAESCGDCEIPINLDPQFLR